MNSTRPGARIRTRSNAYARRRTASPMHRPANWPGRSAPSPTAPMLRPNRLLDHPNRNEATSRREHLCGAHRRQTPEAAADDPSPKARVVSPSRSAASLTIRVRHQNRAGRLLIDRIASQGTRHAVVLVDGAEEAEEVPAVGAHDRGDPFDMNLCGTFVVADADDLRVPAERLSHPKDGALAQQPKAERAPHSAVVRPQAAGKSRSTSSTLD